MKDLRYYLALLEKHHPEGIFRVRKEVDPHLEITYIVKKLAEGKRFPLVYCEKVKGYQMPVVTSVCASRRTQALALETDEANLDKEIMRSAANPIKPKLVKTGPVKEVIRTGAEIDLGQLPILTIAEK